MKFNPGINIGNKLTNNEVREIFGCGMMGGMRRSRKTNTLVIISDETKGLYSDTWKNGIFYYTGMGQHGDQVLDGNQNRTLYDSDKNGVEVHLFERFEKRLYTYRGLVKLAEKPYQERQEDRDGNSRMVWIFPIQVVDDSQIELSEREVAKLSNKELLKRNEMNKGDNESKTTEVKVYKRNPFLKELVKRIADGKCQSCGENAPFYDRSNNPYLEEHHVLRLADGGADSIENVVAICPNCHRKIHILNDEKEIKKLKEIAQKNKQKLEGLVEYEKNVKK